MSQPTTTPTADAADRDDHELPLVDLSSWSSSVTLRSGIPIVVWTTRNATAGTDDADREREEPADAGVVGPELEDTAAGPEAGHQADDARDRREEGDDRARAARGSAGSTR